MAKFWFALLVVVVSACPQKEGVEAVACGDEPAEDDPRDGEGESCFPDCPDGVICSGLECRDGTWHADDGLW